MKHTKLCQCGTCVDNRFVEYQQRIEDYLKQGIIPHSAAQTVMVKQFTVRAHFRRNQNHMTKDEGLRAAVDSYLGKLFKAKGADVIRLPRAVKQRLRKAAGS